MGRHETTYAAKLRPLKRQMPTMLGKIAKVVALFLAGPTLAFVVLFAGCEGPASAFGVMCGHNVLYSLVSLTLVVWFVLATVTALIQALHRKD